MMRGGRGLIVPTLAAGIAIGYLARAGSVGWPRHDAIGLVGALIGAAAALGSTWMLQRRSDIRAELAALAEHRKALRIIETELRQARGAMAAGLRSGGWWPDHIAMRTTRWSEQVGHVASALPTRADWTVIAQAFDSIALVESHRTALQVAFQQNPQNPPWDTTGRQILFNDTTREMVQETLGECESAIVLIERHDP
jgi:hypothetical protein